MKTRRRLYALLCLAFGLVIVGRVWRCLSDHLVLVAPPPTLLFEDAAGRYLAELGADERGHGFWPVRGRPPERVIKATLAAEDARFEQHPGVDVRSVVRALCQNVRRMKVVQGASTLAMQIARLEAPATRSLTRKLAEACVALGITARYGRDAILNHYLTIAPYGNRYHGIAYAARRYFNKPIEDLSWAEAALLASLPRLPGRMNIYRSKGRIRAECRALYVLSRLRRLRWISEEEYGRAAVQVRSLMLTSKQARPSSCLHAILALEREIKSHRVTLPNRPAHIARTSIDLDVQTAVSRIADSSIGELRNDGAGNLAVMVVEKETGKIRGYLGSTEFRDVENKGSIDYALVPRSSGSVLKPFIYGLGMWLKGYTGATLLSDVGLLLDPRRGGYKIRNYDGGHLGPILYRNALANSRNIPAVEVLQSVGIDNAYSHLWDLGLVHRWNDPSRYGVSLALGGLSVSLFDLVRAYGVLASGGTAFELEWVQTATLPRRPAARIIPEDVARQITLFLSDPMARLPSFPRLGWLEYPFPVAVKTGTSQGFRDAWCVAYSQRFIVGAWVGHPDNAPMKRRCGADSAAMIVHKVMKTLHPEEMKGLSDFSFPPPRGFVARRIDMLSGKAARDDTPYGALEWFKPGTEPVQLTDVYQERTLDTRSGRVAGPDCPPEYRQRKRYVLLDAAYARWARESGLDLMPLATEDAASRLRQASRLAVLSPRNNTRFMGDPETPGGQTTIALEASVSPPAPQVVWYVDGKPLCVADYPYATRWRIAPGDHVFQIGLPYAPLRSTRVRVKVSD